MVTGFEWEAHFRDIAYIVHVLVLLGALHGPLHFVVQTLKKSICTFELKFCAEYCLLILSGNRRIDDRRCNDELGRPPVRDTAGVS